MSLLRSCKRFCIISALLLSAQLLLVSFPISASTLPSVSSSTSPGTQSYLHQILFTTHSENPWSRKTPPWFLLHHQQKQKQQQQQHQYIVSRASTTEDLSANNTTEKVSLYEDELGYDKDDGILRDCSSSENLTLSYANTIRFFIHGCSGVSNRLVHTAIIVVWLVILFYLLGTTASDYFSCTLERLSIAWKLSPAVAGVTLLAVGNGAPDVFSSVAAFVSADSSGGIGFSCVLGGVLFITTVVAGTVAIVSDNKSKKEWSDQINLVCFVRDIIFLLVSAGALTVVLLDGKVYLWEAISFFCLYGIYAVAVWAAERLDTKQSSKEPILEPLLTKDTEGSQLSDDHNYHNLHIQTEEFQSDLDHPPKDESYLCFRAKLKNYIFVAYKYGIEWPLALPRRLTIPVVEEERWNRPLAVASCTLAPVFVGAIWILESGNSLESIYAALGVSIGLGMLLGLLALVSTEDARPPKRFLWLWLAGGFFMSVVWFYLVADQVVASLETLGALYSINPALLGLTVLAWGNSIGDLVADLALACGSKDGVQIAVSGCYAGPLFNMIVGLGLSLIIACSKSNPEPLIIADEDGSLFFIVGFLVLGLIWALIMVPANGMRLSKIFGTGLVLLYCVFMVTGVFYIMGWAPRK